MTAVTWRTTKPDKELDYRCDHCGEKANTIHFVPWAGNAEHCLFACPEHDPGGYWTYLDRWLDPEEDFIQHVLDKDGGDEAIVLWDQRVDALRREAAQQ